MFAGTVLEGRVGRYRVLKRIGKGGEGELFVARDERSRQKVVVKLQLPRDFQSTESYMSIGRRIEREYDRLIDVRDVEEIPRVIDRDAYGGARPDRRFLVMEHVDGITVKSWIAEHEPVLAAPAAAVVAQLCAILIKIHRVGIVHCDVTSRNTMLEPDGRIRLLDVGISVASEELSAGDSGSPGSAAPEQYRWGATLTPQVDVFALGALLFEMTTAKFPYDSQRLALSPDTPPPPPFPKNFRAGVPEMLWELGLEMVAIDPKDRPEGAAEVLRRLRPTLPAPGSPASPKATRPDPTVPLRRRTSAS